MTGKPSNGSGAGRAAAAAATLLAALLTGLWTWWALRQGAYFGVIFYPGLILMCLGTVILAFGAPWRLRLGLSKPVVPALACLVGLGVWTMLSALWSPAPEEAIADGQRTLGYALAFVLGIWLCNLLGPRMRLSLAPLALAGLIAGAAAVAMILLGDDPADFLEPDGTLDWPLGYRNANAAFFAISAWAALGLAQDRGFDWRLRGLAAGGSALCLALVLACQSRGSVPALIAALLIYIALSPERLRALGYLALSALPLALVATPVVDLYDLANAAADPAEVLDGLKTVVRMAAIGAAAVALAVLVLARAERDRSPNPARTARSNRVVAIGALLAIGLALIAATASLDDPLGWAEDRLDRLGGSDQPLYSGESSRLGLSLATPRPDLWGVAAEAGVEQPLRGLGAGGFRYRYAAERSVDRSTAHDAHNLALEAFSELGLPGLVLLLSAIGAMFIAAIRARKLGPSTARLTAIAVTIGGYWFVHACLDWFWQYPALTAPTLALLGSAAAPLLLDPAARARGRVKLALVVAPLVLAISVVPPYLAEFLIQRAESNASADVEAAYADLDRAERLNPLSPRPLFVEGGIAAAEGDRDRAVEAFTEATVRRPEEWEPFFQLGLLRMDENPEQARIDLLEAARLNPLERRVNGALWELYEAHGGPLPPS